MALCKILKHYHGDRGVGDLWGGTPSPWMGCTRRGRSISSSHFPSNLFTPPKTKVVHHPPGVGNSKISSPTSGMTQPREISGKLPNFIRNDFGCIYQGTKVSYILISIPLNQNLLVGNRKFIFHTRNHWIDLPYNACYRKFDTRV